MKRRTIVIAATAVAAAGLTAGLLEGCSSSGGSSQGYLNSQPLPMFPTSFTAARPCDLSGHQALCATVNGTLVVLTGNSYQPLTPAQIEQIDGSAPSDAASAYEGTGSQQDPAYDPAVTDPEPPAPEHYTEPDPVEVEPHVVIVDGK